MQKTKIAKLMAAVIMAFVCIGILTCAVSAAEYKLKSKGSEVSFIQTALESLGFYDYKEVTGYYGEVTEASVRAFQKANGLEETGIADESTYNLIEEQFPMVEQTEETKVLEDTAKTGALDWFKEVQYAFAKGTEATITDVETGKSFTVQRTFGHNHADVEPLTKDDAAMIREIWGGKDSWARRAVVVTFGDYIIAGSMVGFAHAGRDDTAALAVVNNLSGGFGRGQNLDAIKGNDFNGHTCLHFLNSLTHGNNKLDKDHQNAVKLAADYIIDNFK